MLNQTGVKKEKFVNTDQILFAVEHQVSVGVKVAQAVGVNVGSKKIAKAGTPLAGNLDARTTSFTLANTDGTDVVGILLHDVDVTAGAANATLLLHGFVNTDRIDTTTQGKLSEEVKKALTKITFMKGGTV